MKDSLPQLLADSSDTLQLSADNIWVTEHMSAVSYPKEQTQEKFQIENDSFWFKQRNQCLLEVFKNYPPAGLCVDVGGGNGFVAQAIQNAGIETALLEPNEIGIKNARLRGIQNLICATWQDAQFRPETLPAVGLFDVLEHIEDDLTFLHSIHQTLTAQGRLYLTVPTFPFLWSAVDVFDGHFRRYTQQSLSQVLQQAGFRIEYFTYFFQYLVPPILLLRALPTKLGILKSKDINNTSSDDKVHPAFHLIFDLIARREQKRIQKNKSLTFGSSCLCVVQKV